MPYLAKACTEYEEVDRARGSKRRCPRRGLGLVRARHRAVAYMDNVHPYNWHWFRTWHRANAPIGTARVDVCRWALGLDYPKRITASAADTIQKTLHLFDTLVTTSITKDDATWEGTSCQGNEVSAGPRLATRGTTGTVVVDREGTRFTTSRGIRQRVQLAARTSHLPTCRGPIHDGCALSQTSSPGSGKARS